MGEPSLDLYQALGVSRDAEVSEIRYAYRKLVLKHHRDKVQDPVLKAQKEDEYQIIQEAYETLTNEDERRKYDDQVRLAELKEKLRQLRVSNQNKLKSSVNDLGAWVPESRSSGSRFSQFFKRSSGGILPLVASSHQAASPVTSVINSSHNIQEERNDSRRSRFRRSSSTSRSHRNGSRGSRGSQNSTRSVGSQVSWEEMDKFDYILQAMDDLVGKHIKRLGSSLLLWHHSTRSPKNQCREILASLQQSTRTYKSLDHERVLDASTNVSYHMLLDLFDELKLELEDFANHDLSTGRTDNPYCKEFGEKIAAYKTRLNSCFISKQINRDMPQPPAQASSVKPKQPETPKPDAFQEFQERIPEIKLDMD